MRDHDPAMIRKAGQILRQIREGIYGYTQRDVGRVSREKWGEDGEVDQAVLSKIERGAIAKPPNLKEAAQLAVLYDRPLSWIAELYGLPVVHVEGTPKEPIAARLTLALRGLSANDPRRERLTRLVDFAIREALGRHDEVSA